MGRAVRKENFTALEGGGRGGGGEGECGGVGGCGGAVR